MKKIINASIAKTAFTFEEDAYAALSSYLFDVREHFNSDPSSQEIIDDIEARIAEILLESKHAVLTTDDANRVIAAMGSVKSFDDEGESTQTVASAKEGARALFRDGDNKVIGGVSSGIAAFFNIDPLIIRLLFIASIFFGGAGVIIYILLWIIIPEAKTPSQKLQMRGDRVTIESLRTFTQAGFTEIQNRSHIFSKIITFPFLIIGKMLNFFLPLARKTGGLILIAIGFFSILGASIALALFATNYNAPYIDTPIREVISSKILFVTALSAYVAFVIPFVFVLLLGVRLFRRLYRLSVVTGFALVGIWTLAVITLVASSVHIAGTYHQYVSTNEAFVERTVTREVGSFTEIKGTMHNATILLKQGTSSIAITGRTNDTDAVILKNEEGVLILGREERNDECFLFCMGEGHLEVVITTPDVSIVDLQGGSLVFEDMIIDTLSITKNGGRIEGTVTATNIALLTENASVDIVGRAENATLSLHNYSNYNSPAFVITNATATVAYPSDVVLNVSNTLNLNEVNQEDYLYNEIEIIGGAKVHRTTEEQIVTEPLEE